MLDEETPARNPLNKQSRLDPDDWQMNQLALSHGNVEFLMTQIVEYLMLLWSYIQYKTDANTPDLPNSRAIVNNGIKTPHWISRQSVIGLFVFKHKIRPNEKKTKD